jgi:hypothetical protein
MFEHVTQLVRLLVQPSWEAAQGLVRIEDADDVGVADVRAASGGQSGCGGPGAYVRALALAPDEAQELHRS